MLSPRVRSSLVHRLSCRAADTSKIACCDELSTEPYSEQRTFHKIN